MIIDIHTHLFSESWLPEKFFRYMAGILSGKTAGKDNMGNSKNKPSSLTAKSTHDPEAEHLLSDMNSAGIDLSIIFPVDFGLAMGEPETDISSINRQYAELAQRHPMKLVAFAGIDPRRDEALAIFTRCIKEWGMKGLKLHPATGFYPNDRQTLPLLEKACQWKVPVLLHTGFMISPLKSRFCQVMYIDDIAADFPDLKIIAAHAGGVFNHRQILSLMAVKPNVMVDISAWQIMAGRDYQGFCMALRELMDFGGSNRVLFGSDSPSLLSLMSNQNWVKIIRGLPEKAPPGIKFSSKEISDILGNNAARILGI